jgi:hypothetical protein
MEAVLKNIFGSDYSEDYLMRAERLDSSCSLTKILPPFESYPAFTTDSEKMDFLLDERIISFFKVAPDQVNMALVLYNFSNEPVELRWSPEFACDNIREILNGELISLEDDELVFEVKPLQLQWVCFEKTE